MNEEDQGSTTTAQAYSEAMDTTEDTSPTRFHDFDGPSPTAAEYEANLASAPKAIQAEMRKSKAKSRRAQRADNNSSGVQKSKSTNAPR